MMTRACPWPAVPACPWPAVPVSLAPAIDDVRRREMAVGLGEIKVSRAAETVLVALGLGSCIAICAWDPVARVGGMAHVVLPEDPHGGGDSRYADVAVPRLLREMAQHTGPRPRLTLKIVGGAWVLPLPGAAKFAGVSAAPTVGERNTRAVERALAQYGLQPAARDVGGNRGRTVRFTVGTGTLHVKTLGRGDTIL